MSCGSKDKNKANPNTTGGACTQSEVDELNLVLEPSYTFNQLSIFEPQVFRSEFRGLNLQNPELNCKITFNDVSGFDTDSSEEITITNEDIEIIIDLIGSEIERRELLDLESQDDLESNLNHQDFELKNLIRSAFPRID